MRKPNKKGCIPCEDVCLKHCEPLICKHGCSQAIKHTCKDIEQNQEADKKDKIISWYLNHRYHVDKLRETTITAKEPSSEDSAHPELWKPIHWNWFFQHNEHPDLYNGRFGTNYPGVGVK